MSNLSGIAGEEVTFRGRLPSSHVANSRLELLANHSRSGLSSPIPGLRIVKLGARTRDVAGRLFRYSRAARMTMWSLTLPQVAATLAATLVAFHTLKQAGDRLLDDRMRNVVLVLVLTTSVLGPVLTQRFAPRLVAQHAENGVGSELGR